LHLTEKSGRLNASLSRRVWVTCLGRQKKMATSTQTSSCSGASLVCLVEDDIPGAQLPQSTPEECTVVLHS